MSQSTSESDSQLGYGYKRIALYATLIGMIVFYLLPIEAGVMTAFKNPERYSGSTPFFPPLSGEMVYLDAWPNAFFALFDGLVNSMVLVIPATILSGLFGSMAAYGLTTIEWRGQTGIYVLFVAGIFIPYQAVLVPLRRFWYQILPLKEVWLTVAPTTVTVVGWELGLQPYHWKLIALIVTHTAYGIPICTLLFRAHYKKLSDEMVEAARLDGASVRRIYRRIILPLSIPMFAVVFIYQFTQIWNDLLFALVLITSGDGSVVTMDLIGLGSNLESRNFPLQMAGAFVAALPTLLVYIVFGDKFAKGVAA